MLPLACVERVLELSRKWFHHSAAKALPAAGLPPPYPLPGPRLTAARSSVVSAVFQAHDARNPSKTHGAHFEADPVGTNADTYLLLTQWSLNEPKISE